MKVKNSHALSFYKARVFGRPIRHFDPNEGFSQGQCADTEVHSSNTRVLLVITLVVTAGVHKYQVPGRPDDCIIHVGAQYLWAGPSARQQASDHLPGAWIFEEAPTFLENLCIPVLMFLMPQTNILGSVRGTVTNIWHTSVKNKKVKVLPVTCHAGTDRRQRFCCLTLLYTAKTTTMRCNGQNIHYCVLGLSGNHLDVETKSKKWKFWLHNLRTVAASIIQWSVRHSISLLRHLVLLLGPSAQ